MDEWRTTAVPVTALVTMLLAAVCAVAEGKLPRYEYVRSAKNRSGLKESDVCLSCRSRRTGHPAEAAIRAWRPTRVEWSYIAEPGFIRFVRESGAKFVGTLNTIENHGPHQDSELIDGSRMVAPWMAGFAGGEGVGWACVNKPATMDYRESRLKIFVEQGVDTIQHDDWLFNLSGYLWGGGCFCEQCLAGFADYLAGHATPEELRPAGVTTWRGFDYREYLRNSYGWTTPEELMAGRSRDPLDHHFRMFHLLSTRRYFDRLLASTQEMAGGPLSLTVNANMAPRSLESNFLLDAVDYLVGETRVEGAESLWDLVYMMKMADALRLPQVVSPFPVEEVNVDVVRRYIALTYALGHRMLIPWDVWAGPGKPRWFGSVEEYGDLYAFVREHGDLLDGYRPYADVVITVPLSSDMRPAQRVVLETTRSLLMAGHPCRYAAYGEVGQIVHVPVEAADFSGVAAVVAAQCGETAPEDRDALRRSLGNRSVFEIGELALPDLARRLEKICPAAYRTDAPDLLVVPRHKPGDPKAPTVVHVVNLAGAGGEASLWLSRPICGNRIPRRALLLRPGGKATVLPVSTDGEGVRIQLARPDPWGILVLD